MARVISCLYLEAAMLFPVGWNLLRDSWGAGTATFNFSEPPSSQLGRRGAWWGGTSAVVSPQQVQLGVVLERMEKQHWEKLAGGRVCSWFRDPGGARVTECVRGRGEEERRQASGFGFKSWQEELVVPLETMRNREGKRPGQRHTALAWPRGPGSLFLSPVQSGPLSHRV